MAGWDYVGRISAANGAPSSVTYLGNFWFITAYHIQHFDNPTGVVLNATSYSIDNSSWTRITNSTGTNADLVLFKVTNPVAGLSPVTVADSTPTANTSLTMIGNGRNRATNLTTWWVDTTPSNWVWNTSFFAGADATVDGYTYAAGTTQRWGENTVYGAGTGLNDGFGLTDVFYTDFDLGFGDAQGATYDSGGGVFTGTAGAFELAGIMLTTSGWNSQPANTAIDGNITYIADLSAYSDQIYKTIPEPSTAVLLAGVGVVFGMIKRIRYMYQ